MTLREFIDTIGNSMKNTTIKVRRKRTVVGYIKNDKIGIPDELMDSKYISIDFEEIRCIGGHYKVVVIYIEWGLK